MKKIGLLVKILTTDSKHGLSFEVVTQAGADIFEKVTQTNEQKCNVSFHIFLNQSQGIVYIQQFEFSD